MPLFAWQNWPVARDYMLPPAASVLVDNDANAAALAELWLARPEILDARDFIFVLVEEGLGTGIVFDRTDLSWHERSSRRVWAHDHWQECARGLCGR